MKNPKKQIIKTLLIGGAKNLRISKKQEMKLTEWIIPYLLDEFSQNKLPTGYPGIMNIKEIRKFIDRWESDELNEEDYKFYYIDRNSEGNHWSDLIFG